MLGDGIGQCEEGTVLCEAIVSVVVRKGQYCVRRFYRSL